LRLEIELPLRSNPPRKPSNNRKDKENWEYSVFVRLPLVKAGGASDAGNPPDTLHRQ
jgi:hypothetical protein